MSSSMKNASPSNKNINILVPGMKLLFSKWQTASLPPMSQVESQAADIPPTCISSRNPTPILDHVPATTNLNDQPIQAEDGSFSTEIEALGMEETIADPSLKKYNKKHISFDNYIKRWNIQAKYYVCSCCLWIYSRKTKISCCCIETSMIKSSYSWWNTYHTQCCTRGP